MNRDISHDWELEELILLWWYFPPNRCFYSMQYLINFLFSSKLFAVVDKKIQKLIWNCKGTEIVKTILKKFIIGGLTYSNCKSSHKIIVIKMMWTGWTYRLKKNNWKFKTNSCNNDQLMIIINTKVIQWGLSFQ